MAFMRLIIRESLVQAQVGPLKHHSKEVKALIINIIEALLRLGG